MMLLECPTCRGTGTTRTWSLREGWRVRECWNCGGWGHLAHLVRFDFSDYERRDIPVELHEARRQHIGASLRFFALASAHLECAPVLERVSFEDAFQRGRVFVADAYAANDATLATTPDELRRAVDRYVASVREIRSVSELVALASEIHVEAEDDYDACRSDAYLCDASGRAFYPEIIIVEGSHAIRERRRWSIFR